MLSTRKQRVILVRKEKEEAEEIKIIDSSEQNIEIESLIIDRVRTLHQEFIVS